MMGISLSSVFNFMFLVSATYFALERNAFRPPSPPTLLLPALVSHVSLPFSILFFYLGSSRHLSPRCYMSLYPGPPVLGTLLLAIASQLCPLPLPLSSNSTFTLAILHPLHLSLAFQSTPMLLLSPSRSRPLTVLPG